MDPTPSPASSSEVSESFGRAWLLVGFACVTDNGVGFDMRYVDKLFGVFQRVPGRGSPAGGRLRAGRGNDPAHIEAPRQFGGNSYIVKPVDFGQFAEMISQVGIYSVLANQAPD